MDNKRLLAAIAISIGILLIFDVWNRPAREAQRQAAQNVLQSQTTGQPLPQANTALNPAGVASTGQNDGAVPPVAANAEAGAIDRGAELAGERRRPDARCPARRAGALGPAKTGRLPQAGSEPGKEDSIDV